MARPLPSRKKAVDLAGGPRKVGSRIRRMPPPKAEKKLTTAEVRQREAWVIGTGMVAVALALMVIMVSVGRWEGWSPAHHVVVIDEGRQPLQPAGMVPGRR